MYIYYACIYIYIWVYVHVRTYSMLSHISQVLRGLLDQHRNCHDNIFKLSQTNFGYHRFARLTHSSIEIIISNHLKPILLGWTIHMNHVSWMSLNTTTQYMLCMMNSIPVGGGTTYPGSEANLHLIFVSRRDHSYFPTLYELMRH